MHVTFGDGSSYTYDNVPDEVTQEQVDTRAKNDFPDKEIQVVGAGSHPDAAPLAPPSAPPTTAQQFGGGLQTAGQVIAQHWAPIAETLAGGLGLYKGVQAVNAYNQGTNAKLYGDLLNNYSKLNNDIRQYEKLNGGNGRAPQELYDARARLGPQIDYAQSKMPGYNPNLNAPAATPNTTPTPAVQNLQQGMNNMAKPPGVPPANMPATTPQPNTPATANDFISKMAQLAQQYAPVAGQAAKVGIPAILGTYSRPLGPPTPQTGQYRGMEINPQTGRPWTAQELQQYR